MMVNIGRSGDQQVAGLRGLARQTKFNGERCRQGNCWYSAQAGRHLLVLVLVLVSVLMLDGGRPGM